MLSNLLTSGLIRKYAWLFTLTVAIGGLWIPKLGLLVMPLMLAMLVMAFFKGKFWCGNICPHGSLFDLSIFSRPFINKIPSFLKSKVMKGLFLAFFAFMMTRRVVNVIPFYGTSSFLDKLGFIFVSTYLMVAIVGSTLSFFFKPRTWCSFCPMGTMQGLTYKVGKTVRLTKKSDVKVTINDQDACLACGKCSQVCPVDLKPHLDFSTGKQFDNEACIRCGLCVDQCPINLLSLATAPNTDCQQQNCPVVQ